MSALIFVALVVASAAAVDDTSPYQPSLHPFAYAPRMSERLYNDIYTVQHEQSLHNIQTIIAAFLAEHPYFADSFSAYDLLAEPKPTLLDKLREMADDGTARPKSTGSAITDTAKVALRALQELCTKTKTWKRLGVSDRCAQNAQDMACTVADASAYMLRSWNVTNENITGVDYSWLLKCAFEDARARALMPTQCLTHTVKCPQVC
jgi:hypothetical protein